MPLLWFVYPLNGSGCRNPDAADRDQDSFLFFILLRLRNEACMRQRASCLIVPLARPNSVCPGTGAMSAFGSAPRRRGSLVEEDSTQRAVD
jgi:hypothetical protein